MRRFVLCALGAFLVGVVGFLNAEDIVVVHKGKTLVLHDDMTWEYAPESGTTSGERITLTTKASQTATVTNPTNKYTIHFDPTVWNPTEPSSKSAEFGFANKAKTGYGMSIYDGLSIPLPTMESVLIKNANKIDPNARILKTEPCTVNGREGELVTYTATGSGIAFTLLTFIATGDPGTIQYTFYTTSSTFEQLRPQFLDMISGLEF